MTAPDDLIRRDTAERAIRARQRDTEDSGIYAGLSVALQELAALPADPVAEAAGKLAELKSAPRPVNAVRSDLHGTIVIFAGFECADCLHKWYPDGPAGWPRSENHAEVCPAGIYRAAVAARAKETR